MPKRLYSRLWKFKFILAGVIVAGSLWGWQVAQQRSTTLVALDAGTGTVRWFQPIGAENEVYSPGAIADGDTVMLESATSSVPEKRFDTYRLQAFSAQSGSALWTKQLNASVRDTADGFGYSLASNSVISLQPKAVYFQAGNELQSLDPKTGQQNWMIKRPWFNTREKVIFWHGLGVATIEQKLAVLQLNSRQSLIEILDTATGKRLKQISITSTDEFTNYSRLTQTNGQIFVAGQVRSKSDSSALTAYNAETGLVRFRIPFERVITDLRTSGGVLQLITDSTKQPERRIEARMLMSDSQTGRSLWQHSESELDCFNFRFFGTEEADTQSVYLHCNRRRNDRDSSTVVALLTQTGQTQWRSLISSDWHSDDTPLAIGTHQLFTLRRARQGSRFQTQAIALDRQTGKILWTVALFEERTERSIFFRSRIAAEHDQVFILDNLPQWQLWFLRMNRRWYLNSAINEV